MSYETYSHAQLKRGIEGENDGGSTLLIIVTTPSGATSQLESTQAQPTRTSHSCQQRETLLLQGQG
jgi:hypothetical protein